MRTPRLLPAILVVLPVAQALGQAPNITRYRVETTNETTVDLSGVGQPNQHVSFTLVTWIAVALKDTTGGRSLRVTVDSMRFEGMVPGLSQESADSARGGTITGLLDPASRLNGLAARPENPFLSDLQGVVHGLFPRVKPGARAGEHWTDTLAITNTSSGANLVSSYVITYQAGAPETRQGRPGTRLAANIIASITGSMENPMAGTMEVTGTIKGESSMVVDANGHHLGGTSKSTSEQLLRMNMAPSPIPVTTSRTVAISLLP